VGQAFSLDGLNDYIRIPDSPSLRPTSLTLEAWVNFSTTSSGGKILYKGLAGTGGNNGSWQIQWASLELNAGIGDLTPGTNQVLHVPWYPVVGRWYHVAYAFDRNTASQSLYLDGALVASGAQTKTIAYDAQPVQIGQTENFGFVNGLIDEAAIYNRALSGAEVAAIFNAGAAGKSLPGTGDLDDPNGVGLVNLLVYGLNIIPNTPSGQPIYAVLTNLNGTKQLQVTILRDPLKSDITITVESSGDLQAWTPIATSTNGGVFGGAAGISGEVTGTAPRWVTITDPNAALAGGGRRFLHIKVSR
jgi:hypothetical protein